MAWIYKHPKSGRWFLGWRVGKKVFNRSTGTLDRKEAEKQLGTCEIMVTTSRQGKLTEAVYRSLTGQTIERVTLKSAAADYLTRIEPRVSKGTLAAYRSGLNGLLESVHASDTAPCLADITKTVVEKYLATVRAQASATTTNNRVKYLGAFFRAADEAHHTGDPTQGLAHYHETPTEADAPDRRPFTQEELQSIFAIAPKGFWKFAIMCSYYTGLRLGRIATLQWQHVNFEKHFLDVKDVKPQKKKKLEVPLHDTLYAVLKTLHAAGDNPKPTDYLWPEQAQKYRARGAQPFSLEFNERVLVPAGLAKPYERNGDRRQFNEVTFHSIRHNAVTGMKEIGTPEMVVRSIIGHTSAAVSAVYSHTTTEMARLHVNKLPTLFKKAKVRK